MSGYYFNRSLSGITCGPKALDRVNKKVYFWLLKHWHPVTATVSVMEIFG